MRNRSTCRLSLFMIASIQCFFSHAPLPAQATRLLAYGTTSWGAGPIGPAPTNLTVFEVDPGGGEGTPLPVVPALGASGSFLGDAAFDPVARRIYVFDEFMAGGTLITIDVTAGSVLSSQTLSQNVRNLEFEPSTNRLLAIAAPSAAGMSGALVEVNPITGAITAIGAAQIGPLWNSPSLSSNDSAMNRLFVLHQTSLTVQTNSIAVIDTLTGAVLSDVPTTGYSHLRFDSSANQLVAFAGSGVYGPNTGGIVQVDPVTGVASPLSVGHPSMVPFSPGENAVALDEQRRLFHVIAQPATQGTPRLYTFDLLTGDLVADPISPFLLAPFLTSPYFHLFVDAPATPLRGRVIPSINNSLAVGSTRMLTFEALGHAGEYYIPFVSCTPGSFQLPGSNLTLGLDMDACSNLYFFSPAAPLFFNLVPGGSIAGVLPPSEAAQGTVTLPGFVPPGLAFDLFVSFLTMSPSLQWTGVHGMAILHLNS